ncbi:MAG: orotate phosphoribosyltransferase [Verrucomicrobia bacterium]|nr:orotate phosphoribosyltransferase [Verrucomicrobiota bacterium]
MSQDEVLGAFRDTQALLSGHFELRSGLHSDQFFQCAKVLQWPVVTARLCGSLVEKLQAAGIAADTVISPAMGGLFVGHEVARAMKVRSIFAEKQDGKLVLRRGFTVTKGERFVVAEDVVTRGGRVQETIDIVRGLGGVVNAVAVLVDRSGGTAQFGVPLLSLLAMTPVTWPPADCPLCKAGGKADHPGS